MCIEQGGAGPRHRTARYERVWLAKRLTGPFTLGLAFTTLALWIFSGDPGRSVVVALLVMSHVALGGTLLDRTFTLGKYDPYER